MSSRHLLNQKDATEEGDAGSVGYGRKERPVFGMSPPMIASPRMPQPVGARGDARKGKRGTDKDKSGKKTFFRAKSKWKSLLMESYFTRSRRPTVRR